MVHFVAITSNIEVDVTIWWIHKDEFFESNKYTRGRNMHRKYWP